MLNRSAWPPGISPRRELAKSWFSELAPEIRGSYFASTARLRLRATHRPPVADHFFGERSESGTLHSAVLLKMPGLVLKRAAVLRRGTAVAVPLLRLPWYSLRSYPFLFFFRKRRDEEEERASLDLPRRYDRLEISLRTGRSC